MRGKRMIAPAAAMAAVLCSISMFPGGPVYADEAEKTGYWEFVESWDNVSDSLKREGYGYIETISGSASSGFHDIRTITSDGYRYSYTSMEDRFHDGTSCNGETGEATFTFSPLPGSELTPGEELAITAAVNCSTSAHQVSVGGQVMIDYCTSSPDSNDYTYFRQKSDDAYVISPTEVWQAEGKNSGGHYDVIGDYTGTFSARFPKGRDEDSSLYIRFHFNSGSARIDSIYQYRWVDTTPAAVGSEDPGNTSDTETEVPEESYAEEETEPPVTEEAKEEPETIYQTVTQYADENSGEDGGVGIIPAIILGIGGALAAAGALGSSSGKSGDDGQDKKKKTYRMKVYKNFGDGIRKGARPVTVWARIVEIIQGEEINRPELSAKITVSGSGLETHSLGVQNTYMGAEVSIPADSEAQTAALTFTFTGEGGVFRNNIVFKVLGAPEIIFPALSEDGREWILTGSQEPVVMIAGAGGTEKVLFLLENAAEEPKNICFRTDNGFEVTHEKFPGGPFAYYAVIRNNSAPVEKQSGVFGEKRTVAVDITAEFSDGVTAENRFSFELYPEGLTLLYSRGLANDLVSRRPGDMPPKLQDGRLEVISYACYEGFDDKIPFTEADICYAWKDSSGKAHVTDDGRYFTCETLQPTDGVTRLILEKYNCYIGVGPGILTIRPKDSLPEPDEPRYVSLPVSISVDGHTDHAEIPLRLLGVKLDKPSKEWQTEYNQLRKTVIRFFPDDYKTRLRSVEEVYGEPGKFDPSELRIARYEMLRTAIEYWEREKGYQKDWEKLYDFGDSYRKVFRSIADFAFSMVMKYYAGDHEAWITPCKDVVVDCVDDALWCYYYNGKFEANVTEKIEEQAVKALENVIDSFIDVKDKVNFKIEQNEQKKLFFALVAFITVDWTKTYYKMNPKDFWESWRTTWTNLSTMAFKKLVGAGISKVMSSKKLEEFFDSRVMQELNRALPGQAKGKFKPMFLPQEAREFVKNGNVDLSTIREGVWTATNAAGKKVSAELTEMVYFGYREVLENALNALLGEGIGKVMDKTGEAIRNSAEFGMLYLPVKADWFDMEGEDAMISVNLIKLFTSPAGIASTVYNTLFTMMFGPVYPMLQGMFMPEDPGKAALNRNKPGN